MKKRMTQAEEFEIMKIVIDKFLWVVTIIMVYGLFVIITGSNLLDGILYLMAGVILLIIFMIIIVKEYEFGK